VDKHYKIKTRYGKVFFNTCYQETPFSKGQEGVFMFIKTTLPFDKSGGG